MQASASALPPTLGTEADSARSEDDPSTQDAIQSSQTGNAAVSRPSAGTVEASTSSLSGSTSRSRLAHDPDSSASAFTTKPANGHAAGGHSLPDDPHHPNTVANLAASQQAADQTASTESEGPTHVPSTEIPRKAPSGQMRSPSPSSVTSEEEGMIKEDEEEEEEGEVPEDQTVTPSAISTSPRRPLAERFSAAPPPVRRWGYAEPRAPLSFDPHPSSSASSSSSRDRDHMRSREVDRERERDRGWDRPRDKEWDVERDRERERDRARITAPPSRMPVVRAFEEPLVSRLPRGGDSYRPGGATPRPQSGLRTNSGDSINDNFLGRDRDGRDRKSLSPQLPRDRELRDARPDRRDVTSSPATPLSGPNSIGPRMTPQVSPAFRDDLDRRGAQPISSSTRPWGATPQTSRWNKWGTPRDREGRELFDSRRTGAGDEERSIGRPSDLPSERTPLRSSAVPEESIISRRPTSPPNGSSGSGSQRRGSRSSRSPVADRSARSQSISNSIVNGEPASPTSSRGSKALPRPTAFEPPRSDSGWGPKARKPEANAVAEPLQASVIQSEGLKTDAVSQVEEKTPLLDATLAPAESEVASIFPTEGEMATSAADMDRDSTASAPAHARTHGEEKYARLLTEDTPMQQLESADLADPQEPQRAEDKNTVNAYAAQETIEIAKGKSPVRDSPQGLNHVIIPTERSEVVHTVMDERQPPADAVQTHPKATSEITSQADILSSGAEQLDASPMLASTSAAPTLPAEAQIQAGVQGAGPSGMGSVTPAALAGGALTEDIKVDINHAHDNVTSQEEGSYFPTFVSEPLKAEAALSAAKRPNASAEPAISVVVNDSALTYPTAPLVRVSPGARTPLPSPKKNKRELTPLAAQKSQEELDEAKMATIRRLLASRKDLSDEQIAALIERNRRLAEHTTFNVLESAIHGPPFVKKELVGPVSYVAEADFNHARTLLTERLGIRNKRLEVKAERLKSRYRALDADWKAHCARLDRAAELRENARKAANQTGTPGGQQQPQQQQPGLEDTQIVSDGHRQSSILGGGSITSGRANRRGTQSGFGFGDAVRSEAEFLEILASLESADMQDPEARAARTATTVPDQLLNPDRDVPLQEEWDDRNGFVADPVAFYLDEFDPDHWSEEEKITFARKYAIWPKQFGKIASALPDKTTAQCVYYYYLTKHQPGHDYKAITAARNRNQKRKGKSKPKKGKGSALMADLKRTDEIGDDDEPGSPMDLGPLQSRPSLLGAVDAGLLPLAEEDESFDGQGPSTSKKQRRGAEEGTTDSVDVPATPAEKPAKGKGGKKSRGQGKGKAASVSFDQASPYPDSPLPTPTAESSIDPDLAAAEALGALSGVVPMPPPPGTASQPPSTTSKGKKRKATAGAAGAAVEGGAENTGAVQRKTRPSTSSYWSIQERTEFLRGVVIHGKDWTGVSALLGAKSAAQARNFFARNAQVPEFIEAAQLGEDNAHLPVAVREQQAADWIRDRIGLLTEDGSISRGSVTEDTSMEDATPRRGGMGIMSLLNDEAASDVSTRKKPSLQEWFGDESQGRHGPMPSSEDRIFSSSGVLATDEDDSTDTEDPYAPSQYSSRSSTAVHTPTSYQPTLTAEHRPHLPETMGHPPRPSLSAQRPMPPPSVGSGLGTLPRLTSSASSSTDSQRDSYGDYSRYSRSPAYEIRNQLSPLVPLSSSRTGAVEQADIPPYARRALYDRGQAPVYDRPGASMPPPPLSVSSASSAHRHSWGAPSQASGGADSRSSHPDYSHAHGTSPAPRSSSATPYPSETEHQHITSARGSAGPGTNGSRNDYLSPTSSFHPLHPSHPSASSSSASGPPPSHTAPVAANERYYLESSRPSSASASIPPYSSIGHSSHGHGHPGHQGHQGHHQEMNRDRGGDGMSRRPTSSDGRSGLAPSWGSQPSHSSHHPYQHHQQPQYQQQQQHSGSYAPSSSSRELPMPSSMSHASAAAAPPPPPPTLPGSSRDRDRDGERDREQQRRDGADARNGSYSSSYRWSGPGP